MEVMDTKRNAPNRNRKFASGRAWKLWDGPRLAGNTPGPVLFFDDPGLAGLQVEWYAGVEVHKRVLVVALYGRAGKLRVLGPILRETTAPADLAALWEAVAAFAPIRFLMETTGVYHTSVAWELKERFPESQVIVMSAYELSKFVQRTRKNDKVDATRLAQISSVGELLRPSDVPAPPEWVLRELARYREFRVREVTRLKNRVKKVMSAFGWHWDLNFQSQGQVKCLEDFLAQEHPLGEFLGAYAGTLSEKGWNVLAPWASVCLPRDARELLLHLLRDLRVSEELEALSETHLVEQSQAFPRVQAAVGHLAAFPGMGYIEALVLSAEIGDARRFLDSGRFLVYAGIAPTGGTSGVQVAGTDEEKVVSRDKPNARSNRRLRGILTRIAVTILRDCKRTLRKDDLYLYAGAWREWDVGKMHRVYKIAAKVGRKLFHVLQAGEAYDGDVEKTAESTKRSLASSRHSRRQQAYRKAWQARTVAERTSEALLALLRGRKLEEEALKVIAALSTQVEHDAAAGPSAARIKVGGGIP